MALHLVCTANLVLSISPESWLTRAAIALHLVCTANLILLYFMERGSSVSRGSSSRGSVNGWVTSVSKTTCKNTKKFFERVVSKCKRKPMGKFAVYVACRSMGGFVVAASTSLCIGVVLIQRLGVCQLQSTAVCPRRRHPLPSRTSGRSTGGVIVGCSGLRFFTVAFRLAKRLGVLLLQGVSAMA